MARILIIDDETEIGGFLCEVGERLGFEAVATNDPDEFWSYYEAQDPAVLMLDLKMPKIDGIEFLHTLAVRKCQAQIVVISGVDQRILRSALRIGTDLGLNMLGTLTKPIRVQDIRKILEGALARSTPGSAD